MSVCSIAFTLAAGDIFLCPAFFNSTQNSLRWYKEDQNRVRYLKSVEEYLGLSTLPPRNHDFTTLDEIGNSANGTRSSILLHELFHLPEFNTNNEVTRTNDVGSKSVFSILQRLLFYMQPTTQKSYFAGLLRRADISRFYISQKMS